MYVVLKPPKSSMPILNVCLTNNTSGSHNVFLKTGNESDFSLFFTLLHLGRYQFPDKKQSVSGEKEVLARKLFRLGRKIMQKITFTKWRKRYFRHVSVAVLYWRASKESIWQVHFVLCLTRKHIFSSLLHFRLSSFCMSQFMGPFSDIIISKVVL